MIRKHTRFIQHLSETDILFNWKVACRIGTELALLAEELSMANQFPAAEAALGFGGIFNKRGIEVSPKAMFNFTQASREAYRTEQIIVFDTLSTAETKRRPVHVFIKFFKKTERVPFHATQVMVGEDGMVREFLTN